MKKKSAFVFILLLFATVMNSRASYTVNSLSVLDKLSEDATLSESVDISLINNGESVFRLAVPSGAYDILVNGTPVEYNSSIELPINCTVCRITVVYSLDRTVSQESKDHYVFSKALNFPDVPAVLHYEVQIPPGYAVGQEHEPTIIPKPSDVKTDGANIIIVWSEKNPALPKIYSVSYRHVALQKPLDTITSFLAQQVWLIVICFSAGILAGYLIRGKAEKKNVVIPPMLFSPDERIILDLLKDTHEKMSQKDIGKRLSWSKSKVSGLMSNLENKRIIGRERVGRNYRITLLKEIDSADDSEL